MEWTLLGGLCSCCRLPSLVARCRLPAANRTSPTTISTKTAADLRRPPDLPALPASSPEHNMAQH
ncbi:hypothetical protein E4U41_004170, partial [Claviceps citrina]